MKVFAGDKKYVQALPIGERKVENTLSFFI